MKTLKEWAEAHGVMFVGRSAGVYTTGTVSAAALEEIFAEADALRRERDELAARTRELTLYAAGVEAERDKLAARLAEIEAQKPVAWQSRFTDGGGWGHCSERHAQMVEAAPHEWPGYEVRALFAHPAQAAAPERADHFEGALGMVPERAEPAGGCGACGDASQSRGSCRLADESPTPAARPCRCGPDKCPDSVACPKGGAA